MDVSVILLREGQPYSDPHTVMSREALEKMRDKPLPLDLSHAHNVKSYTIEEENGKLQLRAIVGVPDIFQPPDPTMPPSPEVIHLIHQGQAQCGLRGPPNGWPRGHRWAALDDFKKVTCPSCRKSILYNETAISRKDFDD